MLTLSPSMSDVLPTMAVRLSAVAAGSGDIDTEGVDGGVFDTVTLLLSVAAPPLPSVTTTVH